MIYSYLPSWRKLRGKWSPLKQALSGGPLIQARNFAVMTGVNAGISCVMRRLRGKEDVQSRWLSFTPFSLNFSSHTTSSGSLPVSLGNSKSFDYYYYNCAAEWFWNLCSRPHNYLGMSNEHSNASGLKLMTNALLLQHGGSFWFRSHVFIGEWIRWSKSSSKCSLLWSLFCTRSGWIV